MLHGIAMREMKFLMACRYMYYCKDYSLVNDNVYDAREARFLNEYRLPNPLQKAGSSNESSYTINQKNFGESLKVNGVHKSIR